MLQFDTDNDGHLTSREIAEALKSRGVGVSTEQVEWYIRSFEENKSNFISRGEFPAFVFSMAVADLHAHPHLADGSSSTDSCDLP